MTIKELKELLDKYDENNKIYFDYNSPISSEECFSGTIYAIEEEIGEQYITCKLVSL